MPTRTGATERIGAAAPVACATAELAALDAADAATEAPEARGPDDAEARDAAGVPEDCALFPVVPVGVASLAEGVAEADAPSLSSPAVMTSGKLFK
jgi:hypothetical protein